MVCRHPCVPWKIQADCHIGECRHREFHRITHQSCPCVQSRGAAAAEGQWPITRGVNSRAFGSQRYVRSTNGYGWCPKGVLQADSNRGAPETGARHHPNRLIVHRLQPGRNGKAPRRASTRHRRCRRHSRHRRCNRRSCRSPTAPGSTIQLLRGTPRRHPMFTRRLRQGRQCHHKDQNDSHWLFSSASSAKRIRSLSALNSHPNRAISASIYIQESSAILVPTLP